ncbi:MAG TPA: helix-turn-helix transcriptional regulator [Lacunisphaera sp.]|nr:helix-turn-helix transcriptional regulator [Lacunisphaera sp.]
MTLLKCLQTNLRRIRKEQGLTQAQLAESASVEYKAYQALEAGTANPTLKTLERLAKALKVHGEELFRR